ncbi:YggS family pyridoxal phosphate-dependent enzyme [Yunchengibacter salinarum]|uniref:YggS family pyridoxal phosphate-dependent enzyme n=1 Tax=Yunchengibacter salinarum TaxID=3133399 RepID=UPI0035B619EC
MTHTSPATIQQRIDAIRADIRNTCAHAGVPENQPRLIAVSKVQPDDRIEAALAAGHRIYGENRVQEAASRWQDRRAAYPDLHLVLIGGLQSNKVADAVALFDEIQTVDRPRIARRLKKEMDAQQRPLPVMIQVNTGEEEQKTGVVPADLPDLLALCHDELGLDVTGLMAIPPVDDEPALHFALLKKLKERHGLARLSMGMSGDYATAAAMGSDDIRVGTAFFGPRETDTARP